MIDYKFVEGYRSSSDYRGLSTVYHKGHRNGWDGKKVLDNLIEKHGMPSLEPEIKTALTKVLSLILWGEFAAWQTSGSLAFELNDFDAKMAATSQVHDEARHFYVMCDYMERVLGVHPKDAKIPKIAEVGLGKVIQAGSLSKKLLGMQLMVEPVAIVIFSALRKNKVEPILTELLELYIKDEARHISLGVKHLPKELEGMSWRKILELFVWQSRLLKIEIDGLLELKESFSMLGINYIDLFKEAKKRQIVAAEEMLEHLNIHIPIRGVIESITETYLMYKRV